MQETKDEMFRRNAYPRDSLAATRYVARCHNLCIVFTDSPELKLVQPGGGDGEKVGGRTEAED